MKKSVLLAAAVAAVLGSQAYARDTLNVVGSSTVYPFTTVVAEQFGKTSKFNTPKVEGTGSGGGMKLFCAGVGVEHPDATGSSRRIKQSEFDQCQRNGVKDIIEVKVGYDGIAIANSKQAKPMDLTLKDVFLALAKEVPDPNSKVFKLITNPYKTWKDVNPSLPNIAIEVIGPPPTSGTRDAFVELAMEGGCKKFEAIAAEKTANKNNYKRICHTLREDGAYIEGGEHDNLIVQKLIANPEAVGVFGFSFLDQNSDKVQGASINGVPVTFESIADGSYPVSRPMYMYAKKAHIGSVPGIEEFLAEYTSEKAWGDEGYLVDKGMIPMPKKERQKFANDVKNLTPMSM